MVDGGCMVADGGCLVADGWCSRLSYGFLDGRMAIPRVKHRKLKLQDLCVDGSRFDPRGAKSADGEDSSSETPKIATASLER